jgi:rhomboid protease GluP
LFIAGKRLESLVGRAWFAAIYTVGALCGSLACLALNPASIVSVGASGAIMGLFAAMLIISLHYPPGAVRTGLLMNAMYVLVPSLLPLMSAFQGHRDYAAHIGGAVGGATVSLVMLAIWSRAEPWPKFSRIAATFAIVGALALAYPVTSVLKHYPTVVFSSQLIPPDKFPRSLSSARTLDLVAHYPRDPRARLMRASELLAAGDLAGVEREARAGLAEEKVWHTILPMVVSTNLRVALAIALADGRREEAVTVAQPVCSSMKDGPQRGLLDARKLCGT